MRRALRVRVFPDVAQEEALTSQWGAVRFVWNKALWAMSHAWKVHRKSLDPVHDIKKVLAIAKRSPRYAWLRNHDSMALQQALIELGRARAGFFSGRTRYPRFKRRHGRQSSYHCSGKIGFGVDDLGHLAGNGFVSIPKMEPLRANIHRDVPKDWDLKSVRMTRSPSGKVFATLLFEDGRDVPELSRSIDAAKIVGIDLGLTSLVVTSDGDIVKNPRHVRKAAARVKRRSRALARKKKGSSNHARARAALARAHETLANARADHLHKASRRLIDNNHAIATETLRIRNMMQNRRLASAIGDAGWGELIRQVAYKASRAGKHHVMIPSFTPSTKTCSVCGLRADHLTLSDRTWNCACGAVHDRDVNAAINIRAMGIAQLMAQGYGVIGRSKTPAGMPLEAV